MDAKKLIFLITALKSNIKKYHSLKLSFKKRKLKIQIIKLFFLCKKLLNNMNYRSRWVRYIFTEERRFLQGASNNLLIELEQYDQDKYFNYLRMTPELFYHLLDIVGPSIQKRTTLMREAVPAKTRLQIFLRYLASGNSMVSLSFEFRVGVSTVCNIIRDTADAIYEILSPQVLLQNPRKEDWERISKEFDEKWNMPHCIGAVDGRHMVIQVKKEPMMIITYNVSTITLIISGSSSQRFNLL